MGNVGLCALGALQALGDLFQSICSHAWRILILRHRGTGLERMAPWTRVCMVVFAALLIALCTLLAPAEGRPEAAVQSVWFFLAVALILRIGRGGEVRMAGLAVLIAATEPIGLALRLVTELVALDQALSIWCVMTYAVFCMRTGGGYRGR